MFILPLINKHVSLLIATFKFIRDDNVFVYKISSSYCLTLRRDLTAGHAFVVYICLINGPIKYEPLIFRHELTEFHTGQKNSLWLDR